MRVHSNSKHLFCALNFLIPEGTLYNKSWAAAASLVCLAQHEEHKKIRKLKKGKKQRRRKKKKNEN